MMKNITKANTKGTKFLAVLAVLAMAFAAFAVVTDFGSSDADNSSLVAGDYTYTGSEGMEIKKSGSTVSFAGIVASNTIYDPDANYPTDTKYIFYTAGDEHSSLPGVYAWAGISITFSSTFDAKEHAVKIEQKNSSLKLLFPNGMEQKENPGDKHDYGYRTTKIDTNGNMTKYYPDTVFKDGNTLCVLVPQDGSNVTLTISYADDEKKVVKTDTIILDFSKTYTDVTLTVGEQGPEGNKHSSDVIGAGYTWDGAKVLTLDNYSGNAVFSGAIQQVTLSGINVIEAYGIDHAIESTYAGTVKMKPVVGQGSLGIMLDDAINQTAALSTTNVDGNLTIEATDVAISIETADAEANHDSCAISTMGMLTIYESTLEVEMDDDEETYGIDAEGGIDMKSCALVTVTAQYGILTANFDIAASNLIIYAGDMGLFATGTVTAIKDSDVNVVVDGGISKAYYRYHMAIAAMAAYIDIESDSEFTASNLILAGAGPTKSSNSATVNILDDVIIQTGAILENKDVFTVGDDVIVKGTLENAGDLTVAGSIIASKIDDKVGATELITGAGAEDPTNNIITTVSVSNVFVLADGNAIADVVFTTNNVPAASFTLTGVAVLTLDKDGKVLALEATDLLDGLTETELSVTVSYTKGETAAKSGYDISVSGRYTKDVDDSEKMNVEPVAVCAETAGVIRASAGTIAAVGGIFANSAQDATFLTETGTINADIYANAGINTTKGAINGDIYAGKLVAAIAITIAKDVTFTGDVYSEMEGTTLNVNGNMTGDVIDLKGMTINVGDANGGKMTGDVIVTDANTAVNISAKGQFLGEISIHGTYKPTATSEATPYASKVAVEVQETEAAMAVKTKKASDPDAGYIYADDDLAAPKANKTATLVVTVGEFKFDQSLTIGNGFGFSAKADTTVTVTKGKTVTITGAIVADENATFNYKAVDKKYGEITNEIVFTVSPNTYYCSFEYALSNAPEGTPLYLLESPAAIANAVSVKKDVTIVLAENVVVTFNTKSLTMADGAYFDMSEGSQVKFGATGEDQKISGAFVYDLNSIVLSNVFFTAADNVIEAVKATSTVPAMIDVTVNGFNAGSIEFVTGDFNGAITFVNTEGDKSSGAVTIDALAEYGGSFATSTKAKIVIDGTYSPVNDPVIGIALSGNGVIFLDEAKTVSIAASDDTKKQNITVTDGLNSVELVDAYVGDNALVFQAVKATTTVPANIALSGEVVLNGGYSFEGSVNINDDMATVAKTIIAAEPASVLTILKNKTLVANGLVMVAGDLNVKTDDDDSYGEILYQVEYAYGAYTVYTMLATAITEGGVTDFTVSDDIVLAGGEEDAPINLGNVELTVSEGKTLTLTGYVTIGTASSSVGAIVGIDGKVYLADHAVLIVYDNAIVDASDVYTDEDLTVKAKASQFIVDKDGAIYATALNDGTALLLDVEKSLKPVFDGYRFTGYSNYVSGLAPAEQVVGATDVAILLDAGKVSVVLSKVVGATYYVNNVAFKQMGVPIDLKVGDIVSAAPNSGYQGDVKVNGQEYIVVDTTTMVITATGMTPVPEPEPTPAEKEAFGITEALLIVLVIMIAILVIIVVFRMMRS